MLLSAPEGKTPAKHAHKPTSPSTAAPSFLHGSESEVTTEQTSQIANVAREEVG